MSSSNSTAPAINSGGVQLRDLAVDTLRRLGFARADEIKMGVTRLEGAYQQVLQHHVAEFRKADQPADPQIVLEALENGRFAYRVCQNVNLWDDLALATMLALRTDQAVNVLRERFAQQIAGWQRRYARRGPYSFEEFVADLLLPRKRSGPRIESYDGRGPLVGWLKQVFLSIWRRPRPADVDTPGDPAERVPTHEATPDERYARLECAERLYPVVRECVEQLAPTRRQVVLLAIVNGVQQKRLAQLYGVRDYRITRLKQASLTQIAEQFMATARRLTRMGEAAVRQCIELLLDRFPVV